MKCSVDESIEGPSLIRLQVSRDERRYLLAPGNYREAIVKNSEERTRYQLSVRALQCSDKLIESM